MRLLFDVVMVQNIWIFGYKSDQNNLHTGCVYAYIRYIYIIFAQLVFLEAGLKFPLSGSFRQFNLRILIHSEASMCFKWRDKSPGWKQILTHYCQGSNKLLQPPAVQPFNAATDTSPTHSVSTTGGWNLNRSKEPMSSTTFPWMEQSNLCPSAGKCRYTIRLFEMGCFWIHISMLDQVWRSQRVFDFFCWFNISCIDVALQINWFQNGIDFGGMSSFSNCHVSPSLFLFKRRYRFSIGEPIRHSFLEVWNSGHHPNVFHPKECQCTEAWILVSPSRIFRSREADDLCRFTLM